MLAVRNQGVSLRSASGRLRGDRDVVMAAVAQSGYALHWAAADFLQDPEVVELAILTSPSIFDRLPTVCFGPGGVLWRPMLVLHEETVRRHEQELQVAIDAGPEADDHGSAQGQIISQAPMPPVHYDSTFLPAGTWLA